jgi:hypothetical protein
VAYMGIVRKGGEAFHRYGKSCYLLETIWANGLWFRCILKIPTQLSTRAASLPTGVVCGRRMDLGEEVARSEKST